MSSSSTITTLSNLDHHQLPLGEQLCYVHCNICDTVLAVSVPSSSLFKTVTVRCGHCTNLFPVNMRALILPSPNQYLQEENQSLAPNFLINQSNNLANDHFGVPNRGIDCVLPRPPVVNRPPAKRQRVPSAYNRFIKDEIQRIKAGNPDISHREAFSAAAKNWAHFPHIHFGLMPDETVKKASMRQQEGEDVMLKDAFFASATVGVTYPNRDVGLGAVRGL